MPFDREKTPAILAELASKGVYVGTSSWKYEGWLEQLYTPDRYLYHGKVAATRFEKKCLKEYGEVFKTVCVDAAYYTFPTVDKLQAMADQVPDDFRFGFKVTGDITIKKFPNLSRFSTRVGQQNPNFLNADMFATAFLKPCEEIKPKVGVLMFEFSRFYSTDYEHGRDFLVELDRFLGELPRGWSYAIEMRNKGWLVSEYFACLAKHGVTHVFNSWSAMPPVGEQMAMSGSVTNPTMLAARFLTKPGRKYEDAKKMFQPYKLTKEVNDEARKAIAALIKMALVATGGNLMKALIYVNNRLEGNALNTIAEVLESGEWR
ncbi:MAG: DUF72 domain-containing protein [Verrucomicrobiota bacterium]